MCKILFCCFFNRKQKESIPFVKDERVNEISDSEVEFNDLLNESSSKIEILKTKVGQLKGNKK